MPGWNYQSGPDLLFCKKQLPAFTHSVPVYVFSHPTKPACPESTTPNLYDRSSFVRLGRLFPMNCGNCRTRCEYGRYYKNVESVRFAHVLGSGLYKAESTLSFHEVPRSRGTATSGLVEWLQLDFKLHRISGSKNHPCTDCSFKVGDKTVIAVARRCYGNMLELCCQRVF